MYNIQYAPPYTAAIWTRLWPKQQDIWLWRPVDVPLDGTLDVLHQLRTTGWEPIGSEPFLLQLLYGQFAEVRQVRLTGSTTMQHWARSTDLERVRAFPVALAFKIPEQVHVTASLLRIAQQLPPPQIGELALVQSSDKATVHYYSLTMVAGHRGLDLWQSIGKALVALASPSEWWEVTPLLAQCLVPNGYGTLRSALHSALLREQGAARAQTRDGLRLLDVANKQARALQNAADRRRRDPEPWQVTWGNVQQMAQELISLYWQAHLAAITQDYVESDREILRQIKAQIMVAPVVPILEVPNYREDTAAREAMLSDKQTWSPDQNRLRYRASNNLAVYLGSPRQAKENLAEAQATLLRIRARTVLTLRIAQALWSLRRHDPDPLLARDGMVLIPYDEILKWRDKPKDSRPADSDPDNPGTPLRVSDGYDPEDREEVLRDFALAAQLYVRGRHTAKFKGQTYPSSVDAPYIRVSYFTVPKRSGKDTPAGVYFAPGDWIADYEKFGNVHLAEIDRRVLQLDPHNDQHELKLALYLTEQWRYHAHRGEYDEPVVMAQLLRLSMIEVDYNTLTSRFFRRIEGALEKLQQRDIIGSYECLTPIDKSKTRWGEDWLAAQWRILPPERLVQGYIDKGITQITPQLPAGADAQERNLPKSTPKMGKQAAQSRPSRMALKLAKRR